MSRCRVGKATTRHCVDRGGSILSRLSTMKIILNFVPPPLKEMSRCRVAKLWRVAIAGTTWNLRMCQQVSGLYYQLDYWICMYVSSVVWMCIYDHSYFRKIKLWLRCDYTLAAVHLILFAGILALWIRITRVIASALIRICCLGGCIYILVLRRH